MNKISCFLPYAGKEQVEKTVNSLQATGLIEEIRLITTDATLESLPDCEILFVDMPYSSATLKAIANAAKGEYTLLYTKETTLEMGMFALERMIHILEDSSAGMVYADHYQIADGKQSNDFFRGHIQSTSCCKWIVPHYWNAAAPFECGSNIFVIIILPDIRRNSKGQLSNRVLLSVYKQ